MSSSDNIDRNDTLSSPHSLTSQWVIVSASELAEVGLQSIERYALELSLPLSLSVLFTPLTMIITHSHSHTHTHTQNYKNEQRNEETSGGT